jgi:hypothetical protein
MREDSILAPMKRRSTMMVEAVKTTDSSLFAVFPQQSDYAVMWNQAPPSELKGFKAMAKRAARKLPSFLQNRILGHYYARMYSLANKSFYQKG